MTWKRWLLAKQVATPQSQERSSSEKSLAGAVCTVLEKPAVNLVTTNQVVAEEVSAVRHAWDAGSVVLGTDAT